MDFISGCQKKLTDIHSQVGDAGRLLIKQTSKWRRFSTFAPSECDVAIVFSAKASRDGERDNQIVDWLIQLLADKLPQLVVHQRLHPRSNRVAFYLTAKFSDLLLGAQALKLQKPLLESTESDECLREFSIDEFDLFQGSNNEATFFSSCERASIITHFLTSLRTDHVDSQTSYPPIEGLELGSDGQIIHALEKAGLIDSVFAVHDMARLTSLRSDWLKGFTLRQPLEAVRGYFGVQVALYFAWLNHYTVALVPIACIGALFWLFADVNNNGVAFGAMSLCSLFWSSIYLESWQWASSKLAYRWGTLDSPPALLEEPRVGFKGTLKLCPITNRPVRTYSPWTRAMVMTFVTTPILLASLLGVVAMTLGFVFLQDYVDDNLVKSDPDSWVNQTLVYLPKILLAVAIFAVDAAYHRLAVWLTELENYRLDREHQNSVLFKVILLQFMNCFFALFYTAFYLQDFDLLQDQLTALLLARQIIGNLREVFLPMGTSRLRQAIISFQYERKRNTDPTSTDKEKEEEIMEVERQATLPPYEGTDEEFIEMLIQFGYVSMFSCVFPLAGLLALANNLVEMRGDAFKLLVTCRRPFALNPRGIAAWQIALQIVSYLSVPINLALLGLSGALGKLFPNLTTIQSIILIVTVEHILLVLRLTIGSLLPDKPTSVVMQIAKLEHRRREALKVLERETLRRQRQQSQSSDSPIIEESQV